MLTSRFTITSSPLRQNLALYPQAQTADATQHSLTLMGFPGGERHARLGDTVGLSQDGFWEIQAYLYSPEGVMDLLLITDALRRHIPEGSEIALTMPYVPYARQDRVANPGEPLSVAVFCRLVNSLGFSRVVVADPHSDVAPALLERVVILPAERFLRHMLSRAELEPSGRRLALVAPDAGARKRVEKLGERLALPVIYAHKHRDTQTGRLSGVAVEGEVPEMPLLVVDDICDGGGTFLLLAEALRKLTSQPLHLYVTHGLFTKGLDALGASFDGIYCAYCAQPELAELTSLNRFR